MKNFENATTLRTSLSRRNTLAIGSLALSTYFAIALWNFWSIFINALGFNATIFIAGIVLLFMLYHGITDWKNHFAWIIPLLLVALSFSLWENPYLKVISILVLPFVASVTFNYAIHPKKAIDIKFVMLSILERTSLLLKLKESIRLIFGRLSSIEGEKRQLFFKVVLGLCLFAALALTIFIPLLSSVDSQFASLMKGVVDWFYDILSFRYIGRIVFTALATIFLISYFLSFGESLVKTNNPSPKSTAFDPIVSGIVLGGVLVLYLIFLSLQFSHLWVNELPFDFHQTEQLVKSGFWQLFILSIINIIFFFGYFKKTNTIVQNILKAFTIASFLLLASAGHRTFLYVLFYGLSYEKFFASYTVIYCALLFLWLAYQLFANRESNLFKYLIFSLLWMYSIATVLPIERMIFSFNAHLSERPDSRIKMNELKMLSYDTLPLAATYRKDAEWQKDWCPWAHNKIRTVEAKKWYEKNLADFANINIPKSWKDGECMPDKESPISTNPVSTLPKDDRNIYTDEDFSFEVKYPNEGWKVIRIFDLEKNQNGGAHIYKDEKTSVSILPLGKNRSPVYPNVRPITSPINGNFDAKKTVWEIPDGSGMISIKLTTHPTSWSSEPIIEARYTKATKKTVEDILESLVLNHSYPPR